MNVVRGNQDFWKRRPNDVAGSSTSNRQNIIAPKSANFMIRNQVVPVNKPTWRSALSMSIDQTPVRPIMAMAASTSSRLRRSSTEVSSGQYSSAGPRFITSSGRSHTTPNLHTPRSISSSANDETNCIVAIAEGRGQARGEVGLAAIDVRRPHLILCQISDTQTYANTLAKLNIFNPLEVLLPNTFCNAAQNSKLFESIRDQYPEVTITTVQRRHFNDTKGLQHIENLCAPEYAGVRVLIAHRFYALSATAALIKYVEFIQNMVFVPMSLRIEYQGSQNTMLIDVDSAQRLELVRSQRSSSPGSPYCLLGIMSHCQTHGGQRLLRASLLQPPCRTEDIEQRLNCVQELVASPHLFHSLQSILGKMSNVEQLLTLCMTSPSGQQTARSAESQLNYVLLLKSSLENVQPLKETLLEAEAPYFLSVKAKLQDQAYENILSRIGTILHDDARSIKGYSAAHLQRCFAVRTGINGLLDVARKTYCELVQDLTDQVNAYKDEYGLPLKVGFNSTRGFHIQMSIAGRNKRFGNVDLPPIFIQVQKTRSTMTMTTQDMVHCDQRIKEALQEIQIMSSAVISELLSEARKHAGCLYQMCEAVAQLDMLLALANISSLPGYVRPTFGATLDVKKSHHPILTFLHHTKPVANDIYSSVDYNFHILTGPNMGGKSIYLKQVALLQILAQIGCFVPAESACFRVTDHIFSRIGFDDSIESNASTFVLENITKNSLVIVDELCRGTSSEEGTAMAWSLCERLLCSPAFTFFTTHFLFLTRLQDVYPNVTNHHLEALERSLEPVQQHYTLTGASAPESAVPAEEGGTELWLRYTHRVVPGVTKLESYGLRLAQLSRMPTSVTDKAKEFLDVLNAARKPLPEVQTASTEKGYYALCAELLAAKENLGGNIEALVKKCQEIKERFVKQNPNWATEGPTEHQIEPFSFPSERNASEQKILHTSSFHNTSAPVTTDNLSPLLLNNLILQSPQRKSVSNSPTSENSPSMRTPNLSPRKEPSSPPRRKRTLSPPHKRNSSSSSCRKRTPSPSLRKRIPSFPLRKKSSILQYRRSPSPSQMRIISPGKTSNKGGTMLTTPKSYAETPNATACGDSTPISPASDYSDLLYSPIAKSLTPISSPDLASKYRRTSVTTSPNLPNPPKKFKNKRRPKAPLSSPDIVKRHKNFDRATRTKNISSPKHPTKIPKRPCSPQYISSSPLSSPEINLASSQYDVVMQSPQLQIDISKSPERYEENTQTSLYSHEDVPMNEISPLIAAPVSEHEYDTLTNKTVESTVIDCDAISKPKKCAVLQELHSPLTLEEKHSPKKSFNITYDIGTLENSILEAHDENLLVPTQQASKFAYKIETQEENKTDSPSKHSNNNVAVTLGTCTQIKKLSSQDQHCSQEIFPIYLEEIIVSRPLTPVQTSTPSPPITLLQAKFSPPLSLDSIYSPLSSYNSSTQHSVTSHHTPLTAMDVESKRNHKMVTPSVIENTITKVEDKEHSSSVNTEVNATPEKTEGCSAATLVTEKVPNFGSHDKKIPPKTSAINHKHNTDKANHSKTSSHATSKKVNTKIRVKNEKPVIKKHPSFNQPIPQTNTDTTRQPKNPQASVVTKSARQDACFKIPEELKGKDVKVPRKLTSSVQPISAIPRSPFKGTSLSVQMSSAYNSVSSYASPIITTKKRFKVPWANPPNHLKTSTNVHTSSQVSPLKTPQTAQNSISNNNPLKNKKPCDTLTESKPEEVENTSNNNEPPREAGSNSGTLGRQVFTSENFVISANPNC